MSPRASDQVPILDRVYQDLGLDGGALMRAASLPAEDGSDSPWLEVGDWLRLAERVNAERLFFVGRDPVLVFSRVPAGTSETEILNLYRRTWCLARPRCLFLAVGEDLRVYALSEPPGKGHDEAVLEPLHVIERSADVADALSAFRRDRLETGATFEGAPFDGQRQRADDQLLADVSAATGALVDSGLSRRTAHTLIERAILVRYLEDRRVLTPSYFEDVASPRANWRKLLSGRQEPAVGPDSLFVTCLGDFELSMTLFVRLAADFNGDLFVDRDGELEGVTDAHLQLLADMLQGVRDTDQRPLFLWAYDFSIVPTSLISTMYELFHHQELEGESTGTHYTPPQLVELMLSDLLTKTVLDRSPRICDPACGSGVFLVEAFRRVVRHEMARTGAGLSAGRLRELALSRVVGVDVDEAAIRLAAFSLYLAMLNYQSPRDIQTAGPLPRLIATGASPDGPRPLHVGDAFDSGGWNANGFDIVVANPPWTEPAGRPRSSGEKWAKARKLAFGDRSPSQLFLWRALSLLSEDGVASLLVGAKSLLNTRSTSKAFRRQWLDAVRLDHVMSFVDVRSDFFEGARAPFALLRFARASPEDPPGLVIYESARRAGSGRAGAVTYLLLDRRIVAQASLRDRDFLWKTYSVAGHRDEALVLRLGIECTLGDLESDRAPARFGWQNPTGTDTYVPPTDRLRELPSVATIRSWGPVRDEWRVPLPSMVKREPHPAIFEGQRLIVGMGVTRVDGARRLGLNARLMSEPLSFPHSMLGIPLGHRPRWQAEVALGVMLSSTGRYWLAMVSGGWGVWRDQVRKEQLMRLPVRLTSASDSVVKGIQHCVRALPEAETVADASGSLWSQPAANVKDVAAVLDELDRHVADLFALTLPERDLISDFWFRAAPEADLSVENEDLLRPYLDTFLEIWNGQLGDAGHLGWAWSRDTGSRTVAVVLETRSSDEPARMEMDGAETSSWSAALTRVGMSLTQDRADALRSHGVFRSVMDTSMVIIKRDERRYWTATAAREDAEATTLQAMQLRTK